MENNSNGANLGFELHLWEIADNLRGHMDPAEYKHVVLGLIFLKYISDVFNSHRNFLKLATSDLKSKYYIDDIQARAEILENPKAFITENVFWVPKDARWIYLLNNAISPTIGQIIDNAMKVIESNNPTLNGILPKEYSRFKLDPRLLGELVVIIGSIGMGDKENRSQDILGRVYEYFLGRFAQSEGKRGGQFYTPSSVVKLLVNMLEPFEGKIYDPCCGSGGMFVQSEKFVETHGGSQDTLQVFGQESNPTTWRLCKMNLAIRGINCDIGLQNSDSFLRDLHPDLQADYILTNPPFNMKTWGAEQLANDIRWKYGQPPKGNANFAWVQHMIHHLAPRGMAGFVLSNGSLSSNDGGGNIRKNIIEADLVDCIVALPPRLFYNTQIAVCLWLISMDKAQEQYRARKGETLFIYAYNKGTKADRSHNILTKSEIELIADTYKSWRKKDSERKYKDIPGFCKSSSIDEIRYHKYALVPGRYVGFGRNKNIFWDETRLSNEIEIIESHLEHFQMASKNALSILEELLHG